jgi:hypothetical protein
MRAAWHTFVLFGKCNQSSAFAVEMCGLLYRTTSLQNHDVTSYVSSGGVHWGFAILKIYIISDLPQHSHIKYK